MILFFIFRCAATPYTQALWVMLPGQMRQRITIATFILSLTFSSCEKAKEAKKTLDFGSFTIDVPSTWDKISQKGVDSYVGQIAIDSTDTLNFDLGWYANDLTEKRKYLIEKNHVYLTKETNKTIFELDHAGNVVDSLPNIIEMEWIGHVDSVDLNKLLNDTVSWTIIDNRKAKLVRPKISGIGTTGIYIDSLWKSGSGTDKFQINGKGLEPDNERLFLQAIRTLRFKTE